MSRSFKHTPMYGRDADSDAVLKTKSHRIIRACVRNILDHVADHGESLVLPEECQFVSVATDRGGKDGKARLYPEDNMPYVIRPRTTGKRLILVPTCESGSDDFANLRLIRK